MLSSVNILRQIIRNSKYIKAFHLQGGLVYSMYNIFTEQEIDELSKEVQWWVYKVHTPGPGLWLYFNFELRVHDKYEIQYKFVIGKSLYRLVQHWIMVREF